MNFPSKLVEDAVQEISKLPGIGKKTALRLAMHLLKMPETSTDNLAGSLKDLRYNIKYCTKCHSIADAELCRICESSRRQHSLVCLVEDTKDVIAIENTSQYFGMYHVLGGVISPIEGIGPSELNIQSLVDRVIKDEVKEVILALPATMEGDTTAFYITKRLKELNVKVSTIARGIPVGGEIEFADEITLGRSILTRTEYNANQG